MIDQYLFCTGNAVEEGRSGWFVGHFVPVEEGLRHQRSVEIKWGCHPKGERRAAFSECKTATTISILISGLFYTKVVIGDVTREVVLREPGDYVIFGPKVPHIWEALKDCIVLSVRFPSVVADQIEVSN